jgi:hypothetical protein
MPNPHTSLPDLPPRNWRRHPHLLFRGFSGDCNCSNGVVYVSRVLNHFPKGADTTSVHPNSMGHGRLLIHHNSLQQQQRPRNNAQTSSHSVVPRCVKQREYSGTNGSSRSGTTCLISNSKRKYPIPLQGCSCNNTSIGRSRAPTPKCSTTRGIIFGVEARSVIYHTKPHA